MLQCILVAIGVLPLGQVGPRVKFPEEWLCKPNVLCHSPTSLCIPIIPDKLLWSSTSATSSTKEGRMQTKQHQQTSNTHTPNGHFQALSTDSGRHGAPPAQSGYGTRDPIPGKRQAHAHRPRRRALCRTCEHTRHVVDQRGDLYHPQSFG